VDPGTAVVPNDILETDLSGDDSDGDDTDIDVDGM
jgi:hypothetical protein